MTSMHSQTRGRSVTRNISPTPEAITIDDLENTPSLNYATIFKTLKHLLDDGIKQATETQFVALQNMFTQRMKEH